MAEYQIGFVMEQALGHVTHSQNLRANTFLAPVIEALWTLRSFEPTGIGAHILVYKSNWRVRASPQARRGLARLARQIRLDALIFHRRATAVLAANWLRRIPSIVSLDPTPLPYDALGQYYQHTAAPALKEPLSFRLNQACHETARHLVTWSQWAKDSLIRDYGSRKGRSP